MIEKPILFSGPMVRAVFAGTKTQTRRAVRPVIPDGADEVFFWSPGQLAKRMMPNVASSGLWARRNDSGEGEDGWIRHLGACPYGAPGDRLWVRETWGHDDSGNRTPSGCWYRADGCALCAPYATVCEHGPSRWRPSIHMPRWASRLSLEVVSIRVERLQEIGEEDAKAEGVTPLDSAPPGFLDYNHLDPDHTHRGAYAQLWDEINGKRAAWKSNPWVWRVEFKRAEVL